MNRPGEVIADVHPEEPEAADLFHLAFLVLTYQVGLLSHMHMYNNYIPTGLSTIIN